MRIRYLLAIAAAATLFSCGSPAPKPDLTVLKVADNLSLRYWMPRPPGDERRIEMDEHLVYQELERVTGVRIVFEYPISSQVEGQLKTMREADDLPDIIEWNWLQWYPSGPDQAIDDGIIISLRDLVIQHAPNLFKMLSDDEGLMRAATSRTGRLYAFPSLNLEPETRAQGGFVVRQSWLDKIELDVPTTISDWRNMLLTMREHNFDTVGSGTEYPFFFPVFRSWRGSDINYYFLFESNAFAGTWGVSHDLYRDASQRIHYGPVQPEYRDMLVELNRWYSEELIHPALASPGRRFFDVIAKCGASIGVYDYLSFLAPMGYIRTPAPSLDEGQIPVGPQLLPAYHGSRSAAVSTSSTHAAEAVQWLDVAYSEWGKRLFNFGIEGESFEFVDGEAELLDDIIISYEKSLRNSTDSTSDLMGHTRILFGGPFEISGAAIAKARRASLEAPEYYDENPWLVGAGSAPDEVLLYDVERRGQFNGIMGPIRTHAQTNFAAFVTGQRPIEDFDTFVREVENLGLVDAVSLIYQADADFIQKPLY